MNFRTFLLLGVDTGVSAREVEGYGVCYSEQSGCNLSVQLDVPYLLH